MDKPLHHDNFITVKSDAGGSSGSAVVRKTSIAAIHTELREVEGRKTRKRFFTVFLVGGAVLENVTDLPKELDLLFS